MKTEQQVEELALLFGQLEQLESKPTMTKTEERRHATLLAKIALVKEGHSLEDLDAADINVTAKRAGLPTIAVSNGLSKETRALVSGFQKLVASGKDFEYRDEVTGHPGLAATMTGNVGSFVPTQFWYGVKNAMKTYDPLFDPEFVTFVETPKGGPLQAPYYSDIENVSVVVGEGTDQSGNETDIAVPGAAIVGAYSFRSPLWRISLESLQDVAAAGGLLGLFERFASDRCARGVGKLLVSGNGTNQPTGLITLLASAGITGIIPSGSGANTGGSETGVNSIGSVDVAKLVFAVDESYRRSDKCAFICNDATRQYLATVVTKSGLPLVNWYGGDAYMLGYPVRTSPSMPNIGNGTVPLIFGDFSYLLVRHALIGQRIQVLRETVGVVEKGEVAFRFWDRYDCGLLYNDPSAPAPFSYLIYHT